ncbi:carbonic anhydrase [Brevundimonas sp.]|uniref:carbonic anhydrase n=1 Tax=Brevundimonas sp. TaxID=1871086 RepID=UPI002E15AF90|nr:carbonic anhydrase [Brevundimonas sp.]
MFGFAKKKSGGAAPSVEPSAPTGEAPVTAAPTAEIAAAGPVTPDLALQQLRDGNAAFLRGEPATVSAADLAPLEAGQSPVAVVVGCADSRTSPELLFGQGFGRLFVVRVAGNTVDERGLASITYAVEHLKAPLVVVLGHTGCGAVAAAGAVVDGAPPDPALEAMLTPILPAVISARAAGGDPVEANAHRVAARLAQETSLAPAVSSQRLRIVPAVMALGSGQVTFLD